MTALKLKLAPVVIPVTLEGPLGLQELELTEMTAAARDDYLDMLATRVKTDAAGTPSVKKFGGLQSELLFHSLRRKSGEALTTAEIQAWPASTVAQLFQAAQEINHLVKAAEEPPAKNG